MIFIQFRCFLVTGLNDLKYQSSQIAIMLILFDTLENQGDFILILSYQPTNQGLSKSCLSYHYGKFKTGITLVYRSLCCINII